MLAEATHLSETIKIIHDRRDLDFDRQEIPTRDRCYREAFAQHPDDPRVVQFARGLAHFAEKKKILINEYDLLAGSAFRYSYGSTMPVESPDDFEPRFRPPIGMEPNSEVQACIEHHGYHADSKEAADLRLFAKGVDNWLFKHWESGHILPGYSRLLKTGVGAVIKEAREALKTADPQQYIFVSAMLMCAETFSEYIQRYAALAAKMAARTENPVYRANLRRIAAACDKIALGPAESFFEAVQLLWLAHEMVLAESFPASLSIGRLDMYLDPYYQKDLESGLITSQEAGELIDALWVKFGANLHAFQNVTLGGLDQNGRYWANDLTYMCLRSTRRLQYDQPLISLRYHESLPTPLWDEAVALVQEGLGFPAFFNDEQCVKAKKKMGFTDEDAWNYSLVGCVELSVEGKEYAKTEVLRINWLKILELMLNKGRSSVHEAIFPPHVSRDLDAIESFEDFYGWYQDELTHITRWSAECVNSLDSAWPWLYPTPFLSTLMEGCIEKGMDVTGGGTIYNSTACNACGQANVVDSLAAIKQLVFDEKWISLSDYAAAAFANFEGHDELLRRIGQCPKFGNDDNRVDILMSELTALFGKTIAALRNPRGGGFQMGLYSVEDHAKMGLYTGATPDGRLAGQPMANAFSPVQGQDVVGPTAVANSLAKTDMSEASNGMVLDLKFNPRFFTVQRRKDALKALIDTFFEAGGMEIQFNAIDRATLVLAQKHPEQYQNLVVRVSGFSAHFTSLIKNTQDDIIARTEYMSS